MRTDEEIEERLNRLWAYTDYKFGPKGDNLRYKHQGMIDALHWVLEGSENE